MSKERMAGVGRAWLANRKGQDFLSGGPKNRGLGKGGGERRAEASPTLHRGRSDIKFEGCKIRKGRYKSPAPEATSEPILAPTR